MEDFHHLMDDLGELLDTTIIPDKHRAVVLVFNDELDVQLEPDVASQNLIIGSKIGELLAGKFRENALAAGLKYNSHSIVHIGTFGYEPRVNQLVFFHTMPLTGLHATAIAELLPAFVAIAQNWKSHIGKSSIPPLDATQSSNMPSIFDVNT